jgi:hypothetical protein
MARRHTTNATIGESWPIARRSPRAALLLFGLVVTFGSVAMGTAVMLLGRGDKS